MADTQIPYCSIVAVDTSTFTYRVCSKCEAVVSEGSKESVDCTRCRARISIRGGNGTRRLYRLQLSIATEDRVIVVVAFDRAAQTLMGCSADHFFNFASLHPFAAESVNEILEGEVVQVVLRPPKSGRAQHMRAVSVLPLGSDFQPVIETLRRMYATEAGCGLWQ